MTDRPTEPEPISDNAPLVIAVLSDLHAYDRIGDDETMEPSHLCTNSTELAPGKHPIKGLLALIDEKHLRADLLLCPGDLGDKARPSGIEYGWTALHEIGEKLGAKLVAATVGNHDIDSRFTYCDHDPKGYLQSLQPPFPLPNEGKNDQYWARGFTIEEQEHYRLVVVNSCAFHGGNESELSHGRFSDRTRDKLRALLDGMKNPKPINLLLCHHHPHKQAEINLGDYDEMAGGQLLLELLGSGRYGDWLVIHGHKHHPKITYAAGTTISTPVVFSAASLCAKLQSEISNRTRNQFHILKLPYSEFPRMGFVGTFESWDWLTGMGWQRAGQTGMGLPGFGGFGFRGIRQPLIQKIVSAVGSGFLTWDALRATVPELDFLLPDDRSIIFDFIKVNHQIQVQFGDDGRPLQVGKSL